MKSHHCSWATAIVGEQLWGILLLPNLCFPRHENNENVQAWTHAHIEGEARLSRPRKVYIPGCGRALSPAGCTDKVGRPPLFSIWHSCVRQRVLPTNQHMEMGERNTLRGKTQTLLVHWNPQTELVCALTPPRRRQGCAFFASPLLILPQHLPVCHEVCVLDWSAWVRHSGTLKINVPISLQVPVCKSPLREGGWGGQKGWPTSTCPGFIQIFIIRSVNRGNSIYCIMDFSLWFVLFSQQYLFIHILTSPLGKKNMNKTTLRSESTSRSPVPASKSVPIWDQLLKRRPLKERCNMRPF